MGHSLKYLQKSIQQRLHHLDTSASHQCAHTVPCALAARPAGALSRMHKPEVFRDRYQCKSYDAIPVPRRENPPRIAAPRAGVDLPLDWVARERTAANARGPWSQIGQRRWFYCRPAPGMSGVIFGSPRRGKTRCYTSRQVPVAGKSIRHFARWRRRFSVRAIRDAAPQKCFWTQNTAATTVGCQTVLTGKNTGGYLSGKLSV